MGALRVYRVQKAMGTKQKKGGGGRSEDNFFAWQNSKSHCVSKIMVEHKSLYQSTSYNTRLLLSINTTIAQL